MNNSQSLLSDLQRYEKRKGIFRCFHYTAKPKSGLPFINQPTHGATHIQLPLFQRIEDFS